MEYPKRLVEAEARMKSAIRKEKYVHRMARGARPSPNTRTAIPETKDSTAPPERREAENLRHPERTLAAHTRKPDFRKSL